MKPRMCWTLLIKSPMNLPSEAICLKGRLHRFDEAREYHDAFLEFCVECGERAIYRKDESGRIDNRLYLRRHYRSFVQPYGSTGEAFRMVYGDRAYFQAMKSKKWKKPVDWGEALTDAKKHLKEMKADKTYS